MSSVLHAPRILLALISAAGLFLAASPALSQTNPQSSTFAPGKDVLKQVAEWVERDGSTAKVPAKAAQLLGLGSSAKEDIATVQIGFSNKEKTDGFSFDVAVISDTHREYFMHRLTPERNIAWRFTLDGKILKTVSISDKGQMKSEPDAKYKDLFASAAQFFLEQSAKPAEQPKQ